MLLFSCFINIPQCITQLVANFVLLVCSACHLSGFLSFPVYLFFSLVSFPLCSLSLAVSSLLEWWLSALLGAAGWPCQLLCITLPLSLELSQSSTWCGICSADFCIKEIRIMLTKRILCKALIWQRESPWICKGFILHLFNLGFIHHAVNFPVGYTGYYALIVN